MHIIHTMHTNTYQYTSVLTNAYKYTQIQTNTYQYLHCITLCSSVYQYRPFHSIHTNTFNTSPYIVWASYKSIHKNTNNYLKYVQYIQTNANECTNTCTVAHVKFPASTYHTSTFHTILSDNTKNNTYQYIPYTICQYILIHTTIHITIHTKRKNKT